MKTNAVRILDAMGIRYQLRDYPVDPNHLDAESVAAKIAMDPQQVFKTLLVRGDRNGLCFAVIPADSELDLKALARLTGDRKADTVPLKELEPLTGYMRGGVTVLGARKPYPVFLEETAILFDLISVSGGQRGLQVLIHPDDYIRVTTATTGAISRDKAS